MQYQQYTRFYSGNNRAKLPLKDRPVFSVPPIQVWVDQNQGSFGQSPGSFSGAPLVQGIDFCLQVDQADGISSRSGLLVALNNWWPRPYIRSWGSLSPFPGPNMGNIKVVYYAGYTVDALPAVIRMACNLLITRLRYILPLGMALGSESYEERSIGLIDQQKDYLTSLIKPMIWNFRNWKW